MTILAAFIVIGTESLRISALLSALWRIGTGGVVAVSEHVQNEGL